MTCRDGLFETVLVEFLWPVDSSPYRTIYGKRWSSIKETCPAYQKWYVNSMASILVILACSMIATFVTKSLQ